MPLDLQELLRSYGYDPDALQKIGLKEEDLQTIHDDYSAKRKELEEAGESIAECFRNDENMKIFVHSIRCRSKDPEGLVEKIIRKKHEEPNREITPENYTQVITDLVGLRVLHLFKDQWIAIHRFITNKWKVVCEDLYETPKAFYRLGDPIEDFEKEKVKGLLELHPDPDEKDGLKKKKQDGYRSIHYIVKKPCVAEIQVRTVFEEAWTEIEHRVFYSRNKTHHSGNHLIYDPYLLVFNQLARTGDEMGTLLLKIRMQLRREIFGRQVIGEMKKEIENLPAIEANKKALLMEHLEALQKYSKFTGVEETLPLGYNYLMPGVSPAQLHLTTPNIRELDPLLDWHPEEFK
jgi:putative GTP pyrophosphokinase